MEAPHIVAIFTAKRKFLLSRAQFAAAAKRDWVRTGRSGEEDDQVCVWFEDG